MSTSLLTMTLAAVLTTSAPPQPQRHAMRAPAPPPEQHVLPQPERALSVPYELVAQHVLLPVSVNGSEPLKLVLDTGMPAAGVLLFETDRVRALELDYADVQARVRGAGGSGQGHAARVALDVELGLGRLRITGTRALVLPRPGHFHADHDGVIGVSLLQRYVCRIDPDSRRFELWSPEHWSPDDEATAIPLGFDHGVPMLEAVAVLGDGHEIPLSLTLDLGASHPLALYPDNNPALSVPDPSIETRLGRGVSGVLEGRLARVASLRIGPHQLQRVLTSFPESQHQDPRRSGTHGNLGNGTLDRFVVTFDYPRKRLWLRPAASFAAPFDYDMTGLLLEPTADGRLRVDAVLPDSPAAEAGVSPGAMLTRVDGAEVGAPDLRRLQERFRQSGQELELELLLGERRRSLSLRTRALI